MLSTSTIDKENQVGPVQRIGLPKSRKALGNAAGYGSKNVLTSVGKGASVARPSSKPRVAPLGSRQVHDAPESSSKASKASAGTDPKPKEQRRKLGDISNRNQGSIVNRTESSKGRAFKEGSIGSESAVLKPAHGARVTAPSSSSATRKKLSTTAPQKVATERSKPKIFNGADVPDIEIALGRLGDEEEALVLRRQEQRFAASMTDPFRVSKLSRSFAGGKREPRETGASSVRPVSSRLSSPKCPGSSTQQSAGGGNGGKRREGKPRGGNEPKATSKTSKDQSLERAMESMAKNDLEELLKMTKPKSGLDDGLGFLFEDVGKDPSLPADDQGDLGTSPAGLLDDDVLLQELDFSLA